MRNLTVFLLALLITIIIGLTSCDGPPQPPSQGDGCSHNTRLAKTKDVTCTIMHVYVTTYGSHAELNEAHSILVPDSPDTSVEGFMQLYFNKENSEYTCMIYSLEPQQVDDDPTLTWGHELAHCMYGKYHR